MKKFVSFKRQSAGIRNFLLQQVRSNFDKKTTEEQTREYDVGFVDVWEQHKHSVHDVRWLLIPGQWKRNEGFKSLIIIQRIKPGEVLLQNLTWISGGRGMDEIMRSRIFTATS